MMKVGVVFPQTEIGADPIGVRDYAQAAESLGYDHLIAFDHVLGANADSRLGWSGAYRHTDMFHEVFVLFGYLVGITRDIELVNGVLILPQRQTALVAKQAAAIDVLSNGRLRLGIGVGWNQVEYEALGENFHNRGRRCEEQIEVMRALWTQELVTFEGKWHKITDAGLNPLPVQRPIPIWFGGGSEAVLDRIGRLGDGWYFPGRADTNVIGPMLDKIHASARKAGRDPGSIGIESSISIVSRTPDEWMQDVEARKSLGATHISVNTMNGGLSSPGEHINAIKRFKEAINGA